MPMYNVSSGDCHLSVNQPTAEEAALFAITKWNDTELGLLTTVLCPSSKKELFFLTENLTLEIGAGFLAKQEKFVITNAPKRTEAHGNLS